VDLKYIFKYRKPHLIAAGLLLFAVCVSLWVSLRPAAVIVTDKAFLTLYGHKRAETKRLLLSVRLKRHVEFVPIADDAGQDAVSFAVDAAVSRPKMVFFPERYLEGAEQYVTGLSEGKAKRISIYAMSGGGSVQRTLQGAQMLEIDRETDLYRAGLCAALMAKNNSGDSGDIEVFDTRDVPANLRDAFIAGLAAMNYTKPPLFRRYTESVRPGATACAVLLAGYNGSVFTAADSIPTILFTWLDPVYTPSSVQVVFDDSLLAVAAQAGRGKIKPHSEAHLVPERIPGKIQLERLFQALAASYHKSQPQ
jgi:hypothetical protein